MATELKNASDSQIASLKSQIAQAQSLLNAQKTAPAVSAPVQSSSSSSGISESQRWYNSTPDASTGLLPDGTKPNSMPSGMSALEQNQWKDQQARDAAKPVTSVSSTDGTQSRDVILKKIADLEVQKKAQQERDLLNNQNKPPVAPKTSSTQYKTIQEVQQAGGVVDTTHVWNPASQAYIPVPTQEVTKEEQELTDAQADLDRRQSTYLTQMEDLIKTADEDTKYSVGVLQNTMNNNIQLMKDLNTRSQDSVFARMSGSAGFVPGMIESALGQELGQGLLRISQIESDYQSKIADIKSAATEKQWGRLGDLFDDSILLKEEKRKALVDLDKKQRKGAIQLQTAIKEQAEADKLYNEVAKSKLDMSAPGIASAMTGDKDNDDAVIKIAAQQLNVPESFIRGTITKYNDDKMKDVDISKYGGYVQAMKAQGKTPTMQGFIDLQSQISLAELAGSRSLEAMRQQSSGGSASDLSLSLYDTFKDKNKMSNLGVSLSGLATTKGSDKDTATKLALASQMANEGNYSGLLTQINMLAPDLLTGGAKTKVEGVATGLGQLDRIEQTLDTLKSLGVKTDILLKFDSENSAKILGKEALLKKYTPSQREAITEAMTTLETSFVDFRREMTGAVFTDKESQGYRVVVPTIGKEDALNSSIIKARRNMLNTTRESLMESKVPDYKDLKKADYAQRMLKNGNSSNTVDDILSNLPQGGVAYTNGSGDVMMSPLTPEEESQLDADLKKDPKDRIWLNIYK